MNEVIFVFAPLDEQDAGLWDGKLIDETDQALSTAAMLKALGRVQPEAAAQFVQCRDVSTGKIRAST